MNNYKSAFGLKITLGYIYKPDANPVDLFSLLFITFFLII